MICQADWPILERAEARWLPGAISRSQRAHGGLVWVNQTSRSALAPVPAARFGVAETTAGFVLWCAQPGLRAAGACQIARRMGSSRRKPDRCCQLASGCGAWVAAAGRKATGTGLHIYASPCGRDWRGLTGVVHRPAPDADGAPGGGRFLRQAKASWPGAAGWPDEWTVQTRTIETCLGLRNGRIAPVSNGGAASRDPTSFDPAGRLTGWLTTWWVSFAFSAVLVGRSG